MCWYVSVCEYACKKDISFNFVQHTLCVSINKEYQHQVAVPAKYSFLQEEEYDGENVVRHLSIFSSKPFDIAQRTTKHILCALHVSVARKMVSSDGIQLIKQ